MTKNDKPLRIKFTQYFETQLVVAPQHVKAAFRDTLQLFQTDPNHAALRNHKLRDRFAGFRSIDITPDWRAIFIQNTSHEGRMVTFRLLGTHKQLYGRG